MGHRRKSSPNPSAGVPLANAFAQSQSGGDRGSVKRHGDAKAFTVNTLIPAHPSPLGPHTVFFLLHAIPYLILHSVRDSTLFSSSLNESLPRITSIVRPSNLSYSSPYSYARPSILFHGMHASDSHIGSFLATMKSMTNLDVDVNLFETHFRPTRYRMPFNVTHHFISIQDENYFDEEVFAPMWMVTKGADYFPFAWVPGEKALIQLVEERPKEFERVWRREWDLIVVDDLFTVTGYSLATRNHEVYGRPYIIMSTTIPIVYWQSLMSLGNPGVVQPSFYAPADFSPSRFSHRLEAASHALLNGFGVKLVNEYLLTRGPSLLGVSDYSMARLVSQASLYFLDDINLFAYPSPVGHDTVHVGLDCPSNDEEEVLPSVYQKLVRDPSSKGVIYIAFGSNVPWKFAPDHVMRVFVDALNHFRDYNVIWSFNGREGQIDGIGSHVHVTKWAPQKAILNDARTVAYITHGGLKSVKEAICTETPILIFPLFAEQPHNAHLAWKQGFGEVLDKESLDSSDFVEKLSRLIRLRSYRERAGTYRRYMTDRLASSSKLVEFHTRRVLTKGKQMVRFKRRGQFIAVPSHLFLPQLAGLFAVLCVLST